MKEKKFTPGPWKIVGDRHIVTDAPIRRQKHICFFPSDYQMTDADKTLISAAPDVLSELENADRNICIMCRIINTQHEECTSCPEREDRLAAIAKAYGES